MKMPLSVCAQLACVLEATARKVGNVHPFAAFDDLTYLDFIASAAAAAPVFDQTERLGVGRTVFEAIRRTQNLGRTNTNLGIVLLLAPLAAVAHWVPVQDGIEEVLRQLTNDDANYAYLGIELARPGGMGTVGEQDVSESPTVTLREAMQLAADRDYIARQYANGFQEVLQIGVPALALGDSLEEAIIHCQLRFLAQCPDSLIARKRGIEEAEFAARTAEDVIHAGWPTTPAGRDALRNLDQWLREVGHQRNPGTTADLVAASLFVALREGNMAVDLSRPWACPYL